MKVKIKKIKCDCAFCKHKLEIGDMGDGDFELRAKDWIFLSAKTIRKIFKIKK